MGRCYILNKWPRTEATREGYPTTRLKSPLDLTYILRQRVISLFDSCLEFIQFFSLLINVSNVRMK